MLGRYRGDIGLGFARPLTLDLSPNPNTSTPPNPIRIPNPIPSTLTLTLTLPLTVAGEGACGARGSQDAPRQHVAVQHAAGAGLRAAEGGDVRPRALAEHVAAQGRDRRGGGEAAPFARREATGSPGGRLSAHKPESGCDRTVFSVSCVKFHIFTCLAMYFHMHVRFVTPRAIRL